MPQPAPEDNVLRDVGPRLRTLRLERGLTLDELSEQTGISPSTISRLENGKRNPTLELLLPISRTYQVPLDDLVGVPDTEDPRIRLEPRTINGREAWPLTRHSDGVQAWKIRIPYSTRPPKLRTHDGYEWLYVLRGQVRLILGSQDFILDAGEAAEFDTRRPHWFGSATTHPAEILSLFGRQGERVHLREDTTSPGGTPH
ncbi:XRE family transcriptional regulator [Arthrobacter sp. ERGS1:01]|uniref:helix-turn-helix domain-containing protein n=1 Tax=Arthrobacter sp. ERGS1:01 TaxID=1704044 RepID=UPI0006B4CD14|nr:XRE family transcriptional regulator [Arthrobacter sp. ERGS1:01]ALE06750.1 XRE family transcriptional regulator [Arthrobacter sp. ERGS1:01]